MPTQPQQNWDSAASGWDKHGPALRQWLRPTTEAMLRMAAIRPGQTVLDLAAGAGDQTLDLAALVGPEGRVIAADISARLLALAAHNARQSGHAQITTHHADAAQLGLPDGSADAAICRLGLMLFADPLAGLAEACRVLRPGGRLCSVVFAGPEQNPCLRVLISTALRHAGLPPRDPFQPGGLCSLGQPGALDSLYRAAGFVAVATTRMDAPFPQPSTADYMAFVQDSAAPILEILSPLAPGAKAAAFADMAAQLDIYQTDRGWIGPNTLLLTVGQKP